MSGRIWLCVEENDAKSPNPYARVWGDTGAGMFADPFKPDNCEFGGWLNHGPKCGWYKIAPVRVSS